MNTPKWFESRLVRIIAAVLLGMLLVADAAFSYRQFYNMIGDGDMVPIVCPSRGYDKVLEDPLGWSVVSRGESYPSTNHYFSNITLYAYFRSVPFLLQKFMEPLDSIYAATAIAKLAIQLGNILMIAAFAGLFFRSGRHRILFASVAIAPLLQATGCFTYAAFIDPSITYVWSFGLFNILLMAFFYPLAKKILTGRSGLPPYLRLLWPFFAVFLALGGSLSPLLPFVSVGFLFWMLVKQMKESSEAGMAQRLKGAMRMLKTPHALMLIFAVLLGGYSYWVGSYNSENNWASLPLGERYGRLAEGAAEFFTSWTDGIPLLSLALLLILGMFFTVRDEQGRQARQVFLALLAFALLYILLMPLGGYRSYRPLIIRRDSIQPVLTLFFMMWGVGLLYFTAYGKKYARIAAGIAAVLVAVHYTLKDSEGLTTNQRERNEIWKIANAEKDCVTVEGTTVFQWIPDTSCQSTLPQAQMMHYWNITPRVIQYRQAKLDW